MKQTNKNLGWIKDYPDIRDFNINTTQPSKNVLKHGKKDTVRKLLRNVGVVDAKKRRRVASKVDNRNWCSPIKNQGQIGSCTAFAAVGMYEYFQNRAFNKYMYGSELFIYKATRNLLGWNGDTGAYIRTAMGTLALFGVPPSSHYPYLEEDYENEPPAFVYSYGQNFQALTYYRLDPLGASGKTTLTNLKKQLRAGLPVMMGFTCYTSLNHETTQATGNIPYPSTNESVIGGHAIMVVGYDDKKTITNPLDGKRKWGVDWGAEGYGWIPYEFIRAGIASDLWCMITAEWVDTGKFGIP